MHTFRFGLRRGDSDKPDTFQLGRVQEGGGGDGVEGQDQSSITEAGAGGHPMEEDDTGGRQRGGHICLLGKIL